MLSYDRTSITLKYSFNHPPSWRNWLHGTLQKPAKCKVKEGVEGQCADDVIKYHLDNSLSEQG